MTPTPTEQVRSPHLLRRLLAVIFGLALVGGLTTACSSNDDDSTDNSSSATTAAFPVSMDTKYGELTIKDRPERVIALNGTIADHLISVGVSPIAVGTNPSGLKYMPWIADDISDLATEGLYVNAEGVNVEKIAELDPDLIIGMPYQVKDRADYDALSSIATTVVPNTDSNTEEWRKSFKFTAKTVGLEEKADEVIADIEEFANEQSSTANVEGNTYSFTNFNGSEFIVGDASILKLLGMKPAEGQDDAGHPRYSIEYVSRIQADYVIIMPTPEDLASQVESIPAIASMRAEGAHILYPDMQFLTALNTPSPKSIEYVIRKFENIA